MGDGCGSVKWRLKLASPAGFEPTAPGLGILCSILLSYGDIQLTLHDSAVFAKPDARAQGSRRVIRARGQLGVQSPMDVLKMEKL